MGMMILLIASGLTLVFGLMDVINFGHGVFISLGAYASLLVLGPLANWGRADSAALNIGLLGLCIVAAMLVTGGVGVFFERVIVRPVYGSHLKQILVTMGGLIVAEQGIHAIWGASPIPIAVPETLRGAFVVGDIAMERYRVAAVAIGLVVFGLMQLVLNRSRIGLLIRAGVENAEMVEALGYRIRRLFVGVFVAGSALAGLGGLLGGAFLTLYPSADAEILVFSLAVVIIGGRGSLEGAAIGSLFIGLLNTFGQVWFPELAYFVIFGPMALLLAFRPLGLFGKAA
jgi:branched-chain amino acid transport system permease protein